MTLGKSLPRWVACALALGAYGCEDDDGAVNGPGTGDAAVEAGGDAGMDGSSPSAPLDPSTAPRVEVDRFAEGVGTLMVRSADNGLPGANAPVDFDQPPFITTGLGPQGETVRYYNFDVQPTTPAPIFVFFREGEDMPVEGQLNVIDVIPGDAGYSDFWQVTRVTVPDDYVANAVTSLAGLVEAGFATEGTDILVNCPVVPDGSTARLRLGDAEAGLVEGWYQDQVVSYFDFSEASLTTSAGMVPLSPIHVTFNVNPDEDGGGPPSGFVTEDDGAQTHNVLGSLPEDDDYSPLWLVNVYDNASFDDVSDLDSALEAPELAAGVATVNCPVVDLP